MEASEEAPVFHDVLEKKGLAMDSENPAKIYIIEIKRVSLYCRSQGDKKRGPQNEGKLGDVVEKKWRKMSLYRFATMLLKTG